MSGAGWVEAPHSISLNVQGDLTIEFWANIQGGSPCFGSHCFPAVSKWADGAQSDRGYFFDVRAESQTPRFTWSRNPSDGFYSSVYGPSVMPLNEWHHYAGVRQGTQMSLYTDGNLDAVSSCPDVPIYATGQPLRIGRGLLYNLDVYANGEIDEVRVWNIARSQADIRAGRFGLIGSPLGLVGHWTFDETLGAALDSSGNGNHGTFQGDAARVACSRPQSEGCADGSREGLVETSAYPDVAACAGSWSGRIDGASAAALCDLDWHVCSPADPDREADGVALATVSYDAAVAISGCFAYNAAHDNDTCVPCTGLQPADDMGAVGANCSNGHYSPSGNSCLGSGRVDADCCGAYTSDHACGQNTVNPHTGVVCCRDVAFPI